MINKIFRLLAVLQVVAVAICNGSELNSNEAEARTFLSQASDQLFKFYDEIANITFGDNDNDLVEVNKSFVKFWNTIVEDTRKFDYKNFKDDELKYAFKTLIREADKTVIGSDQYLELTDSLKELQNLYKEKNVADYHNSRTKLATYPDIIKIIENSDDLEELAYYWSARRKISGEWAEKNLKKIIDAIKKAARLNDLSPTEFWLREFNITEMENLMDELQPLYSELYAFMRIQIPRKSEFVIAPNELIPDHLLEKGLIEGKMFPHETSTSVEGAMMDKFTPRQLYEIIDKFYEKIGFEKFPSSIWGDRIKMSEINNDDEYNEYEDNDDEDDECHSKVWSRTPNIRLEFCNNMYFGDFLNAYGDMANLYYAKEMTGLPAYFFNTPNGLDNAIGKAVILSASTHHNLKAIEMVLDFTITKGVEMRRVLRIAMRSLLNIPYNFVYAKVMTDLLTGNVSMKTEELNSHYWYLMAKYAGVAPPKNHQTNTLDLSYDFLIKMSNNQMSIDFTADILCYQIHKKLCELSGKYPNEPLHSIDISGSKDAGKALKKMMRLGISKPFDHVLATMFPENPAVKADALLEYYNPLKELLATINKKGKQG